MAAHQVTEHAAAVCARLGALGDRVTPDVRAELAAIVDELAGILGHLEDALTLAGLD